MSGAPCSFGPRGCTFDTVISRASVAVALAGLAAWQPGPASAQIDGPALTAEEGEAHQMGLEMAFACSPRRHNQATGSTSTIREDADALSGTAVYFSRIEGTFVALEEYDQALDGHCLVFGWWGDALQPGAYAVARLASSTMMEEEASGEHSFFAWGAVRTAGAMAMLVVNSGSLEIASIDSGTITGSFELTGFVVDGPNRRDATWAGSFSGAEAQP